MAKRQKYIITVDGKPARLQTITPILDVEVLLPASSSELATVFPGEKSANKARDKTLKWCKKLRGSMVDQHPRLQPLLNIKIFNLQTVV